MGFSFLDRLHDIVALYLRAGFGCRICTKHLAFPLRFFLLCVLVSIVCMASWLVLSLRVLGIANTHSVMEEGVLFPVFDFFSLCVRESSQ